MLALRTFAPLAALPPSEMALLARLSRERDFQVGETLAEEGKPVESVRLIVSGRATLSRGGRSIDQAGALDTVGLLAVAAGLPHLVGAVASERIHALEVDADLVDDVLEDDFALFVRVLSLAAAGALAAATTPVDERPAAVLDVLSRADARRLVERADRPPGAGAAEEAAAADADAAGAQDVGLARRLLALHHAPLFRTSPVDGLAAFAKRLEVVRVPKGEAVALGGAAGAMAFVLAGKAVVTLVQEDQPAGEATVPAGAGDLLGGLRALSQDRAPQFVRAQDDQVTLLRGSASDLLDVIEDHHAMGRRILGQILGLGYRARIA